MAEEHDEKSPPFVVPGGKAVEECEDMIRRSLRHPTVKFLKEHLEKAGCAVGDNFIKAVHCHEQISGGFVRGTGIKVCSNHMRIQDEVNQVVIHELIHAYDECRAANLNWANCAHHACSEIRAGHLSGDCHYKRELLRGFMKMRGHEQFVQLHRCKEFEDAEFITKEWVTVQKQYEFYDKWEVAIMLLWMQSESMDHLANSDCVRRRVMKSVIANPYCSEAAAKDAMEAVWDVCYNDTQPFDRAP
ncbi:hypothetical protein Patl1_02891 [Pistacia atlantica]|uniref:Uncharacterized protein n=1 Tax=Pistacia atlantica TaxID=434234 RepID=A0ACC1C744_9ROSI|nr:hypothetical protein Patl1_02891 [Pistacia atlantica]